jgi:hypothetical protein
MSSFLAPCYGRGLKNIAVVVTRKNGQKAARDLDVDKIANSRKLSSLLSRYGLIKGILTISIVVLI